MKNWDAETWGQFFGMITFPLILALAAPIALIWALNTLEIATITLTWKTYIAILFLTSFTREIFK